MTVADLIELLRLENPDAQVVINTSEADKYETLLDIADVDGGPLVVYLDAE